MDLYLLKGTRSISKTLEYAYDDWCIAQSKTLQIQKYIKLILSPSQAIKHTSDLIQDYASQINNAWKTLLTPKSRF